MKLKEKEISKDSSKVKIWVVPTNEELAIDAPDIIIEYNASYLECNYVYIEEYSRYYDVTSKTVLNGNIIRLSLLSDVLASFPDIKSSAKMFPQKIPVHLIYYDHQFSIFL